MKKKMTQIQKRKLLVPYGFMTKGNEMTFFNRDYLPIGTSRDKDLNGEYIDWKDYLELFDWVKVSTKFKNNFTSKKDGYIGKKVCSDGEEIEYYFFYSDVHI
jgi:hypothetical protein